MAVDVEQAGAIPFRRRKRAVEFCLVQTSSGGWGIPKGLVEDGDTLEETALKEAHEEAGLEGRLLGQAVGSYRYRKWGSVLRVHVYLMQVETAYDTWDEDWLRSRCWVSRKEAVQLLADHPVHVLLDDAFEALDQRLS